MVNDLGLLRGYGVFDFLPVRSSLPLFFDEYWTRFRNSATRMCLPFDWDMSSYSKHLEHLFDKNELINGYCRLLLTGGYSSNGFLPDGLPNFIVTTQGPIHYPDKFFTKGIKLVLLEYAREYPHIKSINYMTVLLERDRLREERAEDVLYHENGFITESSRSNFFIIDESGNLVTPPKKMILSGITRGKVLDMATAFMDVQVRPLSINDIKTAQSAFLTSTTKGIMPVTVIDDILINNGHIHPLVNKLRKALSERIEQYIKRHLNITS